MTDPTIQPEQKWALTKELDAGIRLIKAGLRELQRIDGANDFFHLPMALLSQGIERLLKTIICYHYLEQRGELPPRDAFGKGVQGHNLVRHLEFIVNN